MNRRNKRLICAAMTCLMLWSMAAAEDAPAEPETSAAVEKTAEVSKEESEAEATQKPEESAEAQESAAPKETLAPSAGPEETASAEPTAQPSILPTEQPESEPSFEPEEETTAEPSLEPTMEPTLEPTIEPTIEPTVEPTAKPTAMIEIRINNEGAQKDSQEIWQIPVSSSEEEIEFEWSSVEGASVYDVQFTDSQLDIVLAQQTTEPKLTLRVSELGADTYTLIVRALGTVQNESAEAETDGNAETELARGEICFMLSSVGAFPDGFPAGGFPSGMGGGMPAGAGMQEEQGFRVVPGEPLTSDHSSGNKDMSLYGTVKLTLSEEEMNILTLDDTQLDITLDGEEQSFTVQIREDQLVLTPSGESGAWRVNGLALKTLKRSGMTALCLETDAGEIRIDTEISLQGEVYARLCAQGYVSKDYTFIIDGNSVWVEVDGQIYTINENNELVGG